MNDGRSIRQLLFFDILRSGITKSAMILDLVDVITDIHNVANIHGDHKLVVSEELPGFVGQIIGDMQLELIRVRADVKRLEEESCRFYRADGTFTLLSSPEAAVNARIACAQMIQQFQADNQPRS